MEKYSQQGDGGGPVMQRQSDESYQLVGVISTTAGCLVDPLPTLATRVAPYMQWVRYVIAGPDGGWSYLCLFFEV